MSFRHIEVTPATPTIGAYISGVDLNSIRSEDVYEEIKAALWQHAVVFFRGQKMTPDAYLKLGSRFGDMEEHEFFPHIPGHPQIQLISHEGTDNPETDRWHTDVTFRKRPNMVSILRITDLPPSGGDTMWASTAAAFEALGPELQQMLMSLKAEHDLPFHFRRINAVQRLMERQRLAQSKKGGMVSSMMSAKELDLALADRECKLIQDNPSVEHPAVITHPINGRNLLFINTIWTKRFLGIHLDLSDALLRMLGEWIKKPEFMVRFRWEQDSVAMWDNCQTQHYAVFDYAPHYRAGERVTCGSFEPKLTRTSGAQGSRAKTQAPTDLGGELDLDQVVAYARKR
jgi:taurine dioxygenase